MLKQSITNEPEANEKTESISKEKYIKKNQKFWN